MKGITRYNMRHRDKAGPRVVPGWPIQQRSEEKKPKVSGRPCGTVIGRMFDCGGRTLCPGITGMWPVTLRGFQPSISGSLIIQHLLGGEEGRAFCMEEEPLKGEGPTHGVEQQGRGQ